MDKELEVCKIMNKICNIVCDYDREKDFVIEYKKFDWKFDLNKMSHYFPFKLSV